MHEVSDERRQRWEALTEVPLLIASLLFLAAYAVHVLVPPTESWLHGIALAVIGLTWLCFAVDYLVRMALSGLPPLRFLRSNWLHTLVLVLPMLRPLRLVQIYAALQRRRDRPRMELYARVVAYAGTSALLLGFTGALAVYQQERYAPGASILTFGDAVWWTCETLTTIGYGDVVPVTPMGRSIAAVVMAFGLTLLGAVTGSFSSWLIQVFERDEKGPPRNGSSPGAPQ
ncbi:two pore domain potassium channel family protein [Streptomyces sp. BR123]|uniref:potassium channel family protein n=1 Tax=Streptomyces sp. BR123 TaxID=2749828 RepID=UPI0015C45901|nr:potassium channel family protein [Streptomyces sp. BR123]NXY97977.1 two pore domain potassium channel family protein [Streptomyces sp. BR123]